MDAPLSNPIDNYPFTEDFAVKSRWRLRAALERLDGGKRWCQGAVQIEGALCMIGAAIHACCTDEQQALLDQVAAELFPERTRYRPLRDAANVNDHPATTWEDVEKIFEKAILRNEEKVV